MKTAFFYFFLVSLLFFTGCRFNQLDPVVPDKTFNKKFGEQLNLFYPSMCLQRDGQVRILVNAKSANFPPTYTGIIFVVNKEGDVTLANDELGLASIGGGISPRDLGGYFYAEGGGPSLILRVMREDGSYKEHQETPSFSGQSTGGLFPAGLLYGTGIFVYGLTEYNDSLHIAMFDNFWDATDFVYNSAIHIPDMSAGTQHCVQQINDTTLIVCGNGRLVKVKVGDIDPFEASSWEIVWDKAQPDASGISWAVQTADGGFLAVGGGTLLKTDASGNKQWTQSSPGSFILPVRDGSYLITGSQNNEAYAAKIIVDETSPATIWGFTYPGGTQFERALEASDKGFYMVGTLEKGLYVVKTDKDGVIY